MKQKILEQEFNELPPHNRLFWVIWLKKKGYTVTKELTFGQLIELAFALTGDFHYESPADRTTFNNALHYNEIHLAWDGSQPIDTLSYEVNEKLKRRITLYIASKSGTIGA